MLELRVGERVVLHAEVARVALPAEIGDERVVRVEHERRGAGVRGDDLRPALGDDLELAVAVELVAEQVGEQQRPRPQLADHGAQPELVDLEQPEVAVELARRRGGRRAASAAATPPAMFAPGPVVHERLARCARGSAATIAAVVVLPFVALITALPCSSRAPSSPMAWGSSRVSTLPGSEVPPPRPAARTSVPTALAAATFGPSSVTAPAPAARRGRTRIVTGRSAIGSPSA